MYTLYQLAQMWNNRERERWSLQVVSSQTLKMEPDSLSVKVKLCCGATLSLSIPCPNDKISFLGDRVCFKLVDYNDFYLHNKIKIFPNPQGVLFPSPCIVFQPPLFHMDHKNISLCMYLFISINTYFLSTPVLKKVLASEETTEV